MSEHRTKFFGCLSVFLVGCGGAGVGKTPTEQGGVPQYPQHPPAGNPSTTASVDVVNNGFSPASVSLAVGGSVTWTWTGSGHSVTSDGQPSFSPNAPVSPSGFVLGPVVFGAAGTYQYYCTVHGISGGYGGGMLGAIFVQ